MRQCQGERVDSTERLVMIVQEMVPNRYLMVRLDPGQDLLHGIREAVAEAGITHGAILAGVGSLSAYHFHVVSTPVMPPENAFVKGEGPFDILTITGAILDGRVHAHVTFSNTEIAMGGHLEEGCTVLTFAILTIVDTSTPALEMAAWDHVARPPESAG
jgi:predicted DNA-binding protein with PD1-like motif